MPNPLPDVKYCPKCKQDKPISHFSKASKNRDGLYPYCKECVSLSRTGIKVVEDLPGEIWKYINGFQTYMVSNFGRIKHRKDSLRENIRVPHKTSKGYLRLVLSENNRRVTISVHRAVAETFIPNPNAYTTVNHKDFNTENNRVDNLEWLSISENIRHSCNNGRHYRKKVLQIDTNGHIVKEWESAYEVEQALGYFSTLISRCCRGIQKTHKGFIWKFKTT